jgi:hypothetical protein
MQEYLLSRCLLFLTYLKAFKLLLNKKKRAPCAGVHLGAPRRDNNTTPQHICGRLDFQSGLYPQHHLRLPPPIYSAFIFAG